MVAGGHRIIAEDALKLVESLSLSTPTHGHTLVTYASTDNRTTSTVVDRNRYNHRTTESVGSMKEPTNFLIYTACCCSASNLTFHAYTIYSERLACEHTSRGHTGGRSPRISSPPPYGACLSFNVTRLQPLLYTSIVESDYVYERLIGLQYYIHR